MTGREYRYLVVGLGGLGSSAAYWLAKRAGREVLGLEQFELGHDRGESEDHSRIFRLSYHTPGYVALALRAREAWRAAERDGGVELILETGGLDFGPYHSAIPLEGYMASMEACGVPFEHLDAREIARRWPQVVVTDEIHGVFQPSAGIAKASLANATHRRLARGHGATLLDRSPITGIEAASGEFVVEAGGRRYRCEVLVLAGGPWSNSLLGALGSRVPLEVTREQVCYFRTPHLEEFSPGRFPVWIWMDDPCFYGFPAFGESATKAGQDVGGARTTADERDFVPDPANTARVERFLAARIPRALGPIHSIKTCLYTLTPDRDFVIDRVPGHPNALAAIGAGHAYKFVSVIGKILAELAIDGESPTDLAPFRIDREVLRLERPPVNYMV